jgi:CubicO group peptidase (beta-lactamase class C family)
MIAGEAISRAAKMPWSSLIRQRLLDPLHMVDTYLWSERDNLRAARAGNVATSHIVADDKQIPIDNRDGAVGRDGRNVIEAAGSVQSSAHDLTRWMILHLNNGVIEGHRLVSDSTMQEMHSPQVIVPTPASFRTARQLEYFASYGLGWQVWDYRGHPMLWHSGSGNGQLAYMALLPKEKLGVVVLINSWRAPILHGSIAARILDHYLGYAARDYSAEALRADSAARKRGAESWQRFLQTRDAAERATRPARDYAGVYDDSLHGAVTISPGGSLLTLQMGRGEIADLERWNGDSLFVRWRNPVYREDFPTLAVFSRDAAGIATQLNMRLNRDTVRAAKRK